MGMSEGSPLLFPTGDGHVVVYQRDLNTLAVVRLAGDGRAIAAPLALGHVDAFDAARIGDHLIVASVKDTNRGDEAEPGKDRIVVHAMPVGDGAPAVIFQLDHQNVAWRGGPRVVPRASDGFAVMWTSFGGRLQAQEFAADRRPVGAPRTSAPYANNAGALAVATGGRGTTLALLGLGESSFALDALAVLDRAGERGFP